jgi:hypothetical protein
MSTPTTRRHPRSLAEAFPCERAWCLEVYRQPWYVKALRPLIVFLCACVIGWMAAQGMN